MVYTNDSLLTEKGKNGKRGRGIENSGFTSMFSLRLLTGMIKPSRPVRLRPPTVPLMSKLVSLEKKGFTAKLTIYEQDVNNQTIELLSVSLYSHSKLLNSESLSSDPNSTGLKRSLHPDLNKKLPYAYGRSSTNLESDFDSEM